MGAPGTTEGPWRLDSNPSFHRNRVWTQDMRPIVNLCSMGTAPSDLDPEAQANARLIAAAPDLYAALQQAVFVIETIAVRAPVLQPGGDGHQIIVNANAALAKARGES